MSPHRFRAWHAKDKRWIANGEIMDLDYSIRCNAFLFDNDNYDLGRDVVLVQATGLKDKNGKEVFEGDMIIMIMPMTDTTITGTVEWNQNRCAFMINDGSVYLKEMMNVPNIEIIGNVYEHPHLVQP